LEAKIMNHFPDAKVEIRGGGTGDFIVIADGVQLWNKKTEGDFPDEDVIIEMLGSS